MLGDIIPAGCHLPPQRIVLILHLLVVLDALVDVVLPCQRCHLLLQLSLPLLYCFQLSPLLLGHCLCLPQLLLHCLCVQHVSSQCLILGSQGTPCMADNFKFLAECNN